MKTFELIPVNGRKSFGNKATVREDDGVSTLLSYNTEVATYNQATNEVQVLSYHSATTGNHINAFLSFYGFQTMTKSEMMKKYNLKN